MDKEELKKKVKINTVIICILVLLLIVLVLSVVITKINGNLKITNNISNLGMACEGDEYVFYYKYGKGIVKVKNNKEYDIVEDKVYSMNYDKGYIYYMSPSDNDKVDIKKVIHNGDEEHILKNITTSSTKMYLEKDYLYYLTSNPYTISRIDINGENEKSLISREILDFQIKDDVIYFIDGAGYLCKISVEGNDYSKITEKAIGNRFQIYKDEIFYIKDSSLNKINLENLEEKVVLEKNVNSEVYNVTNKGIFYLDTKEQKIYKVNLKGEKKKEVVSVNTPNSKINIIGDEMYYLMLDDESNTYKTQRIKINGKEANAVNY